MLRELRRSLIAQLVRRAFAESPSAQLAVPLRSLRRLRQAITRAATDPLRAHLPRWSRTPSRGDGSFQPLRGCIAIDKAHRVVSRLFEHLIPHGIAVAREELNKIEHPLLWLAQRIERSARRTDLTHHLGVLPF